MVSATQNDLAIDDAAGWVEVTATITGAVSVDCVIQNVGAGAVDIVWGGASAPTSKTGIRLDPMDSVQGNAAKIWARATSGDDSRISTTLL